IPLKIGEAAVTTAGNLSAKYVFHAITIDYDNMTFASEETIKSATLRCLQLADTLQVSTIAFPALGTGSARFPRKSAAEIMTRTIADYLFNDTSITLVILSLYSITGDMNEKDINLFYEHVVAQISVYNSSRRLISLLSTLKDAVNQLGIGDVLTDTIGKLEDEIKKAGIDYSKPSSKPNLSIQPNKENGLGKAVKEALNVTTRISEDSDIELKDRKTVENILHSNVTTIQTLLNVNMLNLNKAEIEKAKYGGVGVPFRLEVAIEELQLEIKKLNERLLVAKTELINFHQTK
ncbi:MAG TPA: macro domain-containing protein, partial [Candidatus Nitrosocosmicus sp.]|nr:macro domain-containing protein [Candidatus Nitrosocosmicus sp.]